MTTVAMCIPTIPPRRAQLRAALGSVLDQTRLPDHVVIEPDPHRTGAAATRNRAWECVSAEWIAFLDDDDELLPHHLETLLAYADPSVDLLYPWFHLPEADDPLAVPVDGEMRSPFGVEFGGEQERYLLNVGNFVPVTVLVRRTLLADVGGFPLPGSERWAHQECEDWGCWRDMLEAGARFRHVPERTWTWHHHGRNTSGRPDRW